MAKIQIEKQLFEDLLLYFDLQEQGDLTEDEQANLYYRIQGQLQEKQLRVLQHEAYTQYKAAQGSQEREKGRQAYLDTRGVPESSRWSQDYEVNR